MKLRNKTIDELLDLEEEYRLERELEEDGSVSKLISVYETLYEKISRDKDNEYRFSLEKVKRDLIHYLVKHGTYLKTVYQRDDIAAEHCLKRAIRYEKNLPIVHYRLGFLHYKKRDYFSALLDFKNAIHFQKQSNDVEYRMNDQQDYNCHLYLANCGLFIATSVQEELPNLESELNVKQVLNYEISPIFQLINGNELYLDKHSYVIHSPSGSRYSSKEDCENLLDTKNTIILDLTGRQDLLVYNGRDTRLSKNQSELLRFLLMTSTKEKPTTANNVFDLFTRANQDAELPGNTYTQNISRLRAKLIQTGIEDIIETKTGIGEPAYFYNNSLPYLIMHRNDDTFILNE